MKTVDQQKRQSYMSPSLTVLTVSYEGILAASGQDEPMRAGNDSYVLDNDKFEF